MSEYQTVSDIITERDQLRAELAAAQARVVKLRESLQLCSGVLEEDGRDATVWLAQSAMEPTADDAALRERIEAAKAEEREACAKVCQTYGGDRRALYKGRPPYKGSEEGRASPYVDGQSDAAYDLAEAIRARSDT